MKLCIDCKHCKEYAVPYYAAHTQVSTINRYICKKSTGVTISPVNGYILGVTETSLCETQRDKEPSTLYPRCGYDGKWFEQKGEIKS